MCFGCTCDAFFGWIGTGLRAVSGSLLLSVRLTAAVTQRRSQFRRTGGGKVSARPNTGFGLIYKDVKLIICDSFVFENITSYSYPSFLKLLK